MAIGLGQMFGFRIRENFQLSRIISRSVSRNSGGAGISLWAVGSAITVYIPLGGSRVAAKAVDGSTFNIVCGVVF